MRTVDDHKLGSLNEHIEIQVTDEPGNGGANHRYEIVHPNTKDNPSATDEDGYTRTLILFQNGPVGESGANGITQETLLAIVIDRLKSFQAGQYSCRENAIALTNCQDAMHWLQHRTRERMARGVEGTNQK